MAIAPDQTPNPATPRTVPSVVAPLAPLPPLVIATERCKGCELCIGACPHHVLELDRSIVNRLGYHPIRLTDEAGCTSCAICAKVCPDAVFTVYARPKER
jgi:2-oxoglutarate ferredoxin oxidoreductase subunit delta